MVKIAVDPGEYFEHSHTTDTTTELVSGAAKLVMQDGAEIALAKGQPVRVPANTSHRIVNLGKDAATVDCDYCS